MDFPVVLCGEDLLHAAGKQIVADCFLYRGVSVTTSATGAVLSLVPHEKKNPEAEIVRFF